MSVSNSNAKNMSMDDFIDELIAECSARNEEDEFLDSMLAELAANEEKRGADLSTAKKPTPSAVDEKGRTVRNNTGGEKKQQVDDERKSKVCKQCRVVKPLDAFYKSGGKNKHKEPARFSKCKTCTLAQQKARNATPAGKAAKKITQAKYAATHKEQIKAKQIRYQPIATRRFYERRQTDINFRVAGSLRNRLRVALQGKQKCTNTLTMLGCTPDEFREWIGSQFTGEMSWDNYGALWEFDHVKPCCAFNLAEPAEQRECFRWENMRPMLTSENRSKNGQVLEEEIAQHKLIAEAWKNRQN